MNGVHVGYDNIGHGLPTPITPEPIQRARSTKHNAADGERQVSDAHSSPTFLPGYCLLTPWGVISGPGQPRPNPPPTHFRKTFLGGKTNLIKEACYLRPILGIPTFFGL